MTGTWQVSYLRGHSGWVCVCLCTCETETHTHSGDLFVKYIFILCIAVVRFTARMTPKCYKECLHPAVYFMVTWEHRPLRIWEWWLAVWPMLILTLLLWEMRRPFCNPESSWRGLFKSSVLLLSGIQEQGGCLSELFTLGGIISEVI